MSSAAYAVRDSATMMRRDLLHARRFPMITISGISLPILFLLLFDGVFGHTLRAGLGAAGPAGGSYIDYLTPGILLMTACSSAETTALAVNQDMTEGIISRFRTMPISRTSVLTGQVLGSLIRTLVSGALVLGVAFALGFRPSASAGEWLAVAAIFTVLTLGVTWLTVAFGLVAKTPAGANSLALLLVILPFVSSAYVPPASMPGGVRWFAQNQPFTPVIQTLRGLMSGTPSTHDAVLALTWCVVMGIAGYVWARSRYERTRPT
jgi:ABC-2 type transport system permease protein